MFEEQEMQDTLAAALPNISFQIRSALTDLRTAMDRLVPAETLEREPSLDRSAAVFYQSYCRLLRTAINLEDTARLTRTDKCPPLYDDDVVGFCRSICEECEALFHDHGLTLRFTADRTGYIMALAPYSLRRTLMNLLSNALKFTPAGGEVCVQVETRRTPIRITVSDNGCGMDADTLSHLFTQHLRSDRMPAPLNGLGLGLLLCRTFVRQLGGTLLVDAAEGRGTRVVLALPVERRGEVRFRDCMSYDYTGGFNRTLVELSDALESRFFLQKYLD